MVSGNDVVRHKPHPEGIIRILTHFGVDPGTTLMVGDSMSDILAAKAAGVRMAAVLWDTYDRERVTAADPDTLFESVGEMDAWFRTLLN